MEKDPKVEAPGAEERASEEGGDERRHSDEASGARNARALEPGILRTLVLVFATGFGTGFSPLASGTVGSLVGVVLFWFMAPPYASWFAYLLAAFAITIVAILVSTAAEAIYRKKDDGRIVIDEIAGYLVTMLWAPHAWSWALIGFLLFRFFDVVKPTPARESQNLPSGWGIVVDDLIAGAYACLALHLLRLIWFLV